MVTIRKYQPKDYEDVKFVTLNSDGPNKDSLISQKFVLKTYCEYYIEQEPENTFVAADENDKAIGYIYCAENYDRYEKVFYEKYLPQIKPMGEERYNDAIDSYASHKRFREEFPAHLHIDVLPEFQRMGLGGKLLNALCEHLREKGIPGVMLTCYNQNEKGMGYYKKYGFEVLEVADGCTAFGIRL